MLPQADGSKPRGCGRVSVVNEELELIYDTFVHYGPDVKHNVDAPKLNLGVYKADIQPENGAQLYTDVLEILKTAFDKSGVIVGHSIQSDIRMLRDLDWYPYRLHDTQRSKEFRETSGQNQPGLRGLEEDVLGREIQADESGHSSVEDARATMELWLHHVFGVEEEGGNVELSARYNLPKRTHPTRVQPTRKWHLLAPPSRVALPNIPGACPPGKMWDPGNSAYMDKCERPLGMKWDPKTCMYVMKVPEDGPEFDRRGNLLNNEGCPAHRSDGDDSDARLDEEEPGEPGDWC